MLGFSRWGCVWLKAVGGISLILPGGLPLQELVRGARAGWEAAGHPDGVVPAAGPLGCWEQGAGAGGDHGRRAVPLRLRLRGPPAGSGGGADPRCRQGQARLFHHRQRRQPAQGDLQAQREGQHPHPGAGGERGGTGGAAVPSPWVVLGGLRLQGPQRCPLPAGGLSEAPRGDRARSCSDALLLGCRGSASWGPPEAPTSA